MKYIWIYSLIVLGLLLFLAFNRHSRDTFDNYHSVLWADASGYHVYLPLVFSDYSTFSNDSIESLVAKTGEGFKIENGKVLTKYTYGVSLLQSPFYAILYTLNPSRIPFSKGYHLVVVLCGVFYGWLGLLFFFHFISSFTSRIVSISVAFGVLFSTNLYYYIVDSGGMSHAYSFFAFAGFLWSLQMLKGNKFFLNLVFLFAALIVTIRPFNIVFIPYLIALYVFLSKAYTRDYAIIKIRGVSLLTGCLLFTFLLLPQLLYWKYAFGDFLTYSYGSESFDSLLSPRILEVLFSTNNGLLLYSPFWIIFFVISVGFIISSNRLSNILGVLSVSLLFMSVYLYSSWWNWHFGCGFGHRAFVEILVPFGILLAAYLDKNWNSKVRAAFLTFTLISALWNLKLTYSYDECWLGGDFDYTEFWSELVVSGTR